jgi:hypothetical protein
MTEQDLRTIPQLAALPVYDEHDERSNAITSARAAGAFAGIRECRTLAEVRGALADSTLVPLGVVRADPGDGKLVIAAYFGEKPGIGPSQSDG